MYNICVIYKLAGKELYAYSYEIFDYYIYIYLYLKQYGILEKH